ncbi:MAG: MBL fold metallo-hydrolase [Treponema sp.]|jgi:glyoxylase-like metal-dependent hydrolase (beta-lactamase superfamily II)|nr:MBL fold metallo-hydrolase [Treponema sp.]
MKSSLLYGILLGVMAAPAFGAGIADEPIGKGSVLNENIFKFQLGHFEVYTLIENKGQGRAAILIGADEEALGKYIAGGVYQSETNTFLIRTPEQTILVDTGFGTTLFESLKTLGVSPDTIDAVLITHLHGDHFSGLQKDGTALFSKADVYVAEQEKEYWTKTNVSQGAVAALAPYGTRVKTFLPGELGSKLNDLLPGITAIAAFGHTPGHTLFQLESSGQKLLIWGDIMHAQTIQFPLPDVSVTYDTDPAAAAAIRKQVLEYAAANNIPIAGMHLTFPAIGNVVKEAGGYRLNDAK